LPIPVIPQGSAEARDLPFELEIDGYLPYAELVQEPAPGGTVFSPVARVALVDGERSTQTWLSGLKPALGLDGWQGGATIEFRWLDKPEVPPEWMAPLSGARVLTVE